MGRMWNAVFQPQLLIHIQKYYSCWRHPIITKLSIWLCFSCLFLVPFPTKTEEEEKKKEGILVSGNGGRGTDTLWYHFKSIDNWCQTVRHGFILSLSFWEARTVSATTDFDPPQPKAMCVYKSYWILNSLEKHYIKINSWFEIDRNRHI